MADIPTRWFLELDAGILGLYPNPSEVKTIRMEYIKAPTDMSVAADEPFELASNDGATRNDRFHIALAYFAIAKILKSQGFMNEARFYDQEYNKLLTQTRDLSTTQLDVPMQTIGGDF